MPEWSIGAVSKTVERFAFQGFESLSLRKKKQASEIQVLALVLWAERVKIGSLMVFHKHELPLIYHEFFKNSFLEIRESLASLNLRFHGHSC